MGYPSLPEHLKEQSASFNLDQVWHDVCEELTDPYFRNRSHHNRKTYAVGCAGPLCKKATRDYARRRAASTARTEYILLDPILLFFFEQAKEQIAREQAQILLRLTS